jgi:diguanylate cyclase (GGDEF)-like protein
MPEMSPMIPREPLAARQAALFAALEPAVLGLQLLSPDAPAPVPRADTLTLPLKAESGVNLGWLCLELAAGADATACATRVQPGVDCLRHELAARDAASRATELKLLRLANELDIDFNDDPQLEKALGAVAHRTGAECAWLSAPRCKLTVVASGRDREPDAAVQREIAVLPARVAALAGQLRRPLAINGPGARPDRSAECRLLIVPLFLGRARHPAWLVLLSPLSAAPYGGWQMLPALTLGQAVARRLEVDLDRRTGLYNRGGLEGALRREAASEGSLILIDIDRLHAINQMYGLAAGDETILAIAYLLAPPVLPTAALVARVAGGAFAVVLPHQDAHQAAEVAAQIQTAAAAIHPGNDDNATVTVSAGVVAMDDLRAPFDKVAVDADFVLKLAKERGRSRVEIHTSGNSSLIRRHDEVFAAADLREALRTKQLVLFAQPIRSLKDTTAPPGFELLMRIRDPSGEMRSPGEFLAAAQRYQLLSQIDRHVVDSALESLAPHRSLLTRMSVSISLNVSGASFTDESFVDHFIEKLRNSRIPPGIIIIEVTEQAAVTNLARAEAMMKRLREAGCGIALDDFGTGANSLAYLRTLPVTRIKIDGSFVRDMMTNARSEAAVKGILQLSRGFKLDTVAEFVETEALANKLRGLGVDKGQGHYFGKPEPLDTALRKLGDEEFSELRDFLEMG